MDLTAYEFAIALCLRPPKNQEMGREKKTLIDFSNSQHYRRRATLLSSAAENPIWLEGFQRPVRVAVDLPIVKSLLRTSKEKYISFRGTKGFTNSKVPTWFDDGRSC